MMKQKMINSLTINNSNVHKAPLHASNSNETSMINNNDSEGNDDVMNNDTLMESSSSMESEIAITLPTSYSSDHVTGTRSNEAASLVSVADSNDRGCPIFGSLNADLAEFFVDTVNRHIQEGLDALPLMLLFMGSDDADNRQIKKDRLMHQLCHVYWKSIDIMEIYCRRNIFTLDNVINLHHPRGKLTSKRRLRIVQAYEMTRAHGVDQLPKLLLNHANITVPPAHMDVTGCEEGAPLAIAPPPPPSPATTDSGNIPTLEDFGNLMQEIVLLHQQLEGAQEQRDQLQYALRRVDQANHLMDQICATGSCGDGTTPLPQLHGLSDNIHMVQSTLTETWRISQALQQLHDAGHELMDRMEQHEQDKKQQSHRQQDCSALHVFSVEAADDHGEDENVENCAIIAMPTSPFLSSSMKNHNSRQRPLPTTLEERYARQRQAMGLHQPDSLERAKALAAATSALW